MGYHNNCWNCRWEIHLVVLVRASLELQVVLTGH